MEHRFGFAWFVGTGISDLFDCFSPKRDAGRFAGVKLTGRGRAEQKECCDKFVTHVTELSQSKSLAKCQKPQAECSRRKVPGERARPRAQSHAPRGAFEWNSLTTNRTNFHEWGAAASSYSRVWTARPLASQDSGAPAAHSPTGRRAAEFLLDAMAALPRKWVKPEVDPPRVCALPRGV
jgi:hypothetical protein